MRRLLARSDSADVLPFTGTASRQIGPSSLWLGCGFGSLSRRGSMDPGMPRHACDRTPSAPDLGSSLWVSADDGGVPGMDASQAARISVRMRPVASAPASARRLVQRSGTGWGWPAGLVDDAALVAGALVLNSVRQARSPLRLTVISGGRAVLVEVEDSCVLFPLAGRPAGMHRDGYGLDLVHRIAEAFGFVQHPDGRRLWARIVEAGTARPAAAADDALPAASRAGS
jgi:hypothetical protein